MTNILDILDRFPLPDSRYEQWHSDKRERLVQEATGWHCNQQVGAAGPIPLHVEAVLKCSLVAEFKPDVQRGKLLSYCTLHQGRDSPLHYLANARLLEPHIIDSYPKRAITKWYFEKLDANIRDIIIARFQGKIMEKWYELLHDIAEYADSLWVIRSGAPLLRLVMTCMPMLSTRCACPRRPTSPCCGF